MPRLGKKTLYLDLDALERLEVALLRLPGRPSLSSFLSDQLPNQTQYVEMLADALSRSGIRASISLLALADEVADQYAEAQAVLDEVLISDKGQVLPLPSPASSTSRETKKKK